jgi:predicted O-linked N-acetylglucosamine transferase (SPINDLY family)
MIIIYLVFEKINKDFENIMRYYFKNHLFKILTISHLQKLNINNQKIILFKKDYYPFNNFESNLKEIIKNNNLSYLSKDNNIIYIPENNWQFNNGSFEITGSQILNNHIFDTSLVYKPIIHEEYKNVSSEYNIIHNIYYNKINYSYPNFYNKNISLKSIHDFLEIEENKLDFYFIVLFIDKNNISLLNDISKINYKNCRFIVTLKKIDYELDIIINIKLSLLSKTYCIYFVKQINNLYNLILNKGLVFEKVLFIKSNSIPDLYKIKKISNDYLLLDMTQFVKCPFYYSKLYDINETTFFRYLDYYLLDNNIKNNSKHRIPLKYDLSEKCLLEIKDYNNLLELINNEIDKNMNKSRENELSVKKITIAILTEKESILENQLVSILPNFEDVELLETLAMLLENTKFDDVKKLLWLKILNKNFDKYDDSLGSCRKILTTLHKALLFNQNDKNIIEICNNILKYDKIIEIIKTNDKLKQHIVYRLLNLVLVCISNEEVIDNISKVFNKLYNIEKITDFNNLLTMSNMDKQYNVIFINFIISNAIKFDSYYSSYTDFINARERIKNNLLNILDIIKNTNINLTLDQLMFFRVGNFDLSYQGLPSVDIFKLKTKLLRQMCPDLEYNIDSNYKHEKIKILFHACMLNRYHSVYKDRHQVIKGLSEDDRFDVYFSTFEKLNNIVKYSYSNAKHILLPKNLDHIKTVVSEYKFDIIVYCEIGMNNLSYYMSFLKLAKIQCNTWGHSDTSGIDTIDYYFSSKLYELPYEESQQHYSEKLILQSSLCTSYVNPMAKYNKLNFKPKEFFGLTQDTVAIFCAQSLFKLNPIFDDYIINILKNTDNSVLVLLDNQNKSKVLKRFNNYKIGSKLRFFPHMDHFTYLNLMNICDFVLDVYPFGGCNSSFEAFSLGKVIITQPSIMINGRFTSGFYKKMGLDELICNSKEEYINFAIKVGSDPEYRNSLELKIIENNNKLFLDKETIQEWKDDLIKIYNDYHN